MSTRFQRKWATPYNYQKNVNSRFAKIFRIISMRYKFARSRPRPNKGQFDFKQRGGSAFMSMVKRRSH